MPRAQTPGHVHQTKIGNNSPSIFYENIFAFQVFVNNSSVVKISHALCYLLRNHPYFAHPKLVSPQMQMSVQGVACVFKIIKWVNV